MTTPTVTELQPALEPVTPDPFIEDLEETAVRHDVGAPLRPADAAAKAFRQER
jgi:hypothetical protein